MPSDAASYWIGERGALVLMFAVGAILPAVVAVQGATGTVVQSLNPRRVLGLIVRLRGDYVLILGFIALVWLFSRFVRRIVDRRCVAARAADRAAHVRVAGGVLADRRRAVRASARHRTRRRAHAGEHRCRRDDDDAPDERARDREIDRIYAEWRGGAHANAWKTVLGARQPEQATRWPSCAGCYQRAAQWPDGRLADRLARELLPRLLAKRSTGEALDLVRERLRKDARFRPAGSADLLTLVHLARTAGDRATARLLLQDFSKLYPGDPAQAVVDRLNTQLQ